MLILSGLFPNAQGNQSMLNSLLGYENEYNSVLITTANLTSNAYMPIDTVSAVLKKTKIFSLWPKWVQYALENISRLKSKRLTALSKENRNDGLINTQATKVTQVIFLARSLVLSISGVFAVLFYKPSVICIYEINGMLAARFIRILFPKIRIFGKFQGTVLGENLKHKDFFSLSLVRHPLDAKAFRHVQSLDMAIMTNDGTHGMTVLEKFGLRKEKILFLPNGVDEKFIKAGAASEYDPDLISSTVLRTISLSRLIGWKRVDRVVEAMALLTPEERNKFHHVIIGTGGQDEIDLIQGLIEKNSLSQTVDFLGGRSIEFVISALANIDLLISVYKPTNVANPVFEALAMGVPVLTIRDETLIEVLGARVEGCFFIDEPGSENLPEMLIEALRKITKNEIEKKKRLLKNIRPPSWTERSLRELDFIRE